MKINFTKKEYRALLDMIAIADWVMHSHAVEQDEHSPEHTALRKKIFSHYKEMEAGDIIEYCEENDKYYETDEYVDELSDKFIDSYDDESFWTNLVDRLAERDVLKKLGIEGFKALDGYGRIDKIIEASRKYGKAFEQEGLESLVLKS